MAELLPKVYINGFPKSGTHLADLMVRAFCLPAAERNWLGNLAQNSWTNEECNTVEHINNVLAMMPPGFFVKGHMAHRYDIEAALATLGYCVTFVYRDFRDVAVSQAHHILSDDPDIYHPGKEKYRALGRFEDVLIAVIEGLDEYPGLFERWQVYAPWFDVPWVMRLSFEEMVRNRQRATRRFADYVATRTALFYGYPPKLQTEYHREIARRAQTFMGKTEHSATFRKGQSGEWRKVFSKRVKETFKSHAGDWLQRLGYEIDCNW